MGMGYSIHAGMVRVADSTRSQRASAAFSETTNDPRIGVMRHGDAGYEIAQRTVKEHNLDI